MFSRFIFEWMFSNIAINDVVGWINNVPSIFFTSNNLSTKCFRILHEFEVVPSKFERNLNENET